jgi:hypothetical protein
MWVPDQPNEEASVENPSTENTVITAPEPALCRMAYAGSTWWFCYHLNGHITPGTETLDEHGYCRTCSVVVTSVTEVPSFLSAEIDL